MQLPFTTEQFLEVFKIYNTSVWPAQIIIYLLAIFAFLSTFSKKVNPKIIFYILTILWLWMGFVYHILFFSAINFMAYIFGLLFITQGLIFIIHNIRNNINYQFEFKWNIFGITGTILILFSLFLYPVINYFNNNIYPATPTFGLPCPTTIFTFGLLLFLNKKIPIHFFIIPLIWSIIGFSAALKLNITADISLIISAIIFVLLVFVKKRKAKNIPALT